MKPLSRWILSILLIAGLSLAVFLLWPHIVTLASILRDQEAVSVLVKGYGIWAPLVILLLHTLQILLAAIPGHMIVIATGFIYKFWIGLGLSLAITVSLSQIVFGLARWGGRPLVTRFVDPKILTRWDHLASKYGVPFFILTFMLPIFPADAMNYVAGLSSITPGKFFIANVLGRLPGILFLTLIGSSGLGLSVPIWIAFILFGILLLVAGQLIIKRMDLSAEPSVP